MNNSGILLLCFLLFLVILFMISSCSMSSSEKDSYVRFGGPPYTSSCEFQPACLWDTARWIQLSNGMQGVCTLHGIACPSFSTDHDRMRNMGLSPTMVSDRFANELSKKEKYGLYTSSSDELIDHPDYEDDSGEAAIGLGMYPTDSG